MQLEEEAAGEKKVMEEHLARWRDEASLHLRSKCEGMGSLRYVEEGKSKVNWFNIL